MTKLYPQEVVDVLEELKRIYEDVNSENDVESYWKIVWLQDKLVDWMNKYYESRYENDIYDDIEKCFNAFVNQTERISNTELLLSTLPWIQYNFWVSGMARAVTWLDDTGLYVFDETYNTYSNFGSDTVKDIIENILDYLK